MTTVTWKKLSCGLAIGFVLASAQFHSVPAHAADYDIGAIHISQPWARATPKGASSGAAYMTITNNGKTPDRVTCKRAGRWTGAAVKPLSRRLEPGFLTLDISEGSLLREAKTGGLSNVGGGVTGGHRAKTTWRLGRPGSSAATRWHWSKSEDAIDWIFTCPSMVAALFAKTKPAAWRWHVRMHLEADFGRDARAPEEASAAELAIAGPRPRQTDRAPPC